MTVITTKSALHANLAVLGTSNDDLAQALRAAKPVDDLQFLDTEEGVPSALYLNRPLASRRRPKTEATRLVEHLDYIENASFVISGFGLGYHVQAVAERVGKRGLVVVFEPDVSLLRAVFERIDHSTWLAKSNVIFVHDPDDRAALTRQLSGCEPILAMGLEFIDHPASRTRLGNQALTFSETFTAYMTSMKTTLMTTLIRSLDTIRNNLFNLPQYVGGEGVKELEDLAKDLPGVIVSAGPSLHKNIHELAKDGVRDRCVIIATQTTLKPLLKAGVKPHFVTALDYHEISKRFYEDLDASMLQDVTLVVETKAHPIILESYPGPIRCCGVDLLDQLLGEQARDMGRVPMGSTVAHLAMYLARHLGCNPIAMIGQDLGFPDGLYYAPGTAIEQVWGPELNPFNTMEMMQWQRIARHRGHLSQVEDQNGKTIYTDQQMATYLNQFERDFAQFSEEGIEVIDATEGGVAKQHVTNQPLREVLDQHATQPLPTIPIPSLEHDAERVTLARTRIGQVRKSIAQLREVSTRTIPLLQKMLQDQHDPEKMEVHFKKMDKFRAEVERRMEAFTLIGYLNQLGEFKRLKADRRLDANMDLDPLQRQHAELQRDLTNVQ
ncbi:MAG: DUF115 domain-containing protein, partial [Planctomycetota bacterium]|nr:DUF115 domain-containing protein [Planctomycetota bacterium]